jgi:glycosyltransferase involved in cell wall biosynthesis
MKRRAVILTELIAPYRIPVFNALAGNPEIDLHVIFLSETDRSIRQWRAYSNEMQFSYEVLPSWRRRLGKYNILLNRNVTVALRDADPKAVLCGGYNYVASWQAMVWARRNDVQFLLWCESTANDLRRKRMLVETAKEKFLQNCDGLVVPGKSSYAYMQQMGIPDEKLFVAPNAVDSSLFSRLEGIANERGERLHGELGLPDRYFLFVGRLVRAKGTLDLLHAYAMLPQELRAQVGLVFAGDGPARAELESMARSIFPGSVHFAGFVHRDALASYYALAECLVLPTHSDTWGMVVNEAMVCGLPIICTDVAGCAAELVQSNGRIVPPRDPAHLSSAMQELAADGDLRSRMSRESRSIIRAYSPEACADGIANAVAAGEMISV